jgi:uncharacterized protein
MTAEAPVAPLTPPQPQTDSETDGFWRAAARGEFALCHCQSCGLWLHPPLELCRRCGGPTAFDTVSGGGAIYSYIVIRHPTVPGYEVPYPIVLVELDDQPGLRFVSRLVGAELDSVKIGQRVIAAIEDLPGGTYRIPVFRLARE